MEKIKKFLKIEYGSGSGSGSGQGSGSGNGYGYGDCYGYGFGSSFSSGEGSGAGAESGYGSGPGSGSGNSSGSGAGAESGYGSGPGSGSGNSSGYGYGDDSGIKAINGLNVYEIDDVPTVITHVRGNIARGGILNSDLSISPCYIVKNQNFFAHGETLKKAHSALLDKLLDNMTVEERIEMFLAKFNLVDKYLAREFFDWHNKLTGSCEMGRMSFVKDNDINLDKDKFTVDEFICLCENSYGSDIIGELKREINNRRSD